MPLPQKKPKHPSVTIPFLADPPLLLIPDDAGHELQTEQPGLRCRDCHCRDLRVYYTRPLKAGKVRRKRICRNCGREIVTTEQETFQH